MWGSGVCGGRSQVLADQSPRAPAIFHLAGNLNPGPNLVLVSQISATQSRSGGLLAGIGLTIGAVVWAAAAAIGLGLLAYLTWLQETIRILGGGYLIDLGVRMIFGSKQSRLQASRRTKWQTLRQGLPLNLANPYCLIFFGGSFAALLPADCMIEMCIAAVAVIFVDALCWYSILALLFSVRLIQSSYARFRKWLDRAIGGALGIFGFHLMLSSR
jgi:threonine/homoserine/homoserine lactone efflux protein